MTTAVISNYLENKIIDHVLRNTAYSSPGTSVYIALHTGDPGEAGGANEVAAGDYARVQVTAWDAPASRATANTNQINFATAVGDWGTVSWISICDNSSGGNMLFRGQLTASRAVPPGVQFYIPAGDLDVTLDGAFSNYLSHALLSHVLRNTAYTTPGTSIYVGLYNTDPTAADTGSEVSGTSYARKQITAWDAPVDGDTENTNIETFATPGGAWTTCNYIGIRDNSSGGNLLFFAAVGTPFTAASGDTVRFQAGALDVTVS